MRENLRSAGAAAGERADGEVGKVGCPGLEDGGFAGAWVEEHAVGRCQSITVIQGQVTSLKSNTAGEGRVIPHQNEVHVPTAAWVSVEIEITRPRQAASG